MIGWTLVVRELAELVLAQFTDLTESELKLLCATPTGQIALCGHSTDDGNNNPYFAISWGLERDIRAELVRWLCVSRDAAKFIDPRGIHVRAARITGELDLSYARVEFPLRFDNCQITDRVDLRFARLDGLAMDGSVTAGMAANGLVVRGSINLRNGFCATGEVRLDGVNVGGILNCRRGRFANPRGDALSADGARISGDVFLRNGFNAEGEVRLLGAYVGGDLDCRGGKFANQNGEALCADRAKVEGDVCLRDGFSAEGEVRLGGANVGGDLDCSGGRFANPPGDALGADGARVKGDVLLRDGFSAQGEVSLVAADIGGDLDCRGGKFVNEGKNAINVDGIRVKGDVFFANKFEANGEIRLVGVEVGGDLALSDARFAEGSRVQAGRANVRGRLSWWDMPDTPVALDLSHASVGPIGDSRESWPGKGKLNLVGLVYSRFAAGPSDAASRLEWLNRQSVEEFKPQPFQQLARVLREDGDNDGARRVLVAMENSRLKDGKLSWRSRAWAWALRLTIGYGYRPFRASWWVAAFVLLGFFLFSWGQDAGVLTQIKDKEVAVIQNKVATAVQNNDAAPVPDEDASETSVYLPFNGFIYSLETFLPGVNLQFAKHWLPAAAQLTPQPSVDLLKHLRHWPFGWLPSWEYQFGPNFGEHLRWYFWLHILAGWFFTTMFIAGVTGLVRKD